MVKNFPLIVIPAEARIQELKRFIIFMKKLDSCLRGNNIHVVYNFHG